MRIHILGIAGTFMAGIALIAKQLGHEVSGHDAACYSPMKEQLANNDISVTIGYDISESLPRADIYIIGNAVSRGNLLLEKILSFGLQYCSAPEWLRNNVLFDKWVIAVAGTHGKTTTSAIITHILEQQGLNPGFLVGGILDNFTCSARVTDSEYFVIEADEYDTSYFDKQPKFMHYRAKTLLLNNLEFDHADIYKDLADIVQQFKVLVNTIPGDGLVIYPESEKNLKQIVSGNKHVKSQPLCYCAGADTWYLEGEGVFSKFDIGYSNRKITEVKWNMLGRHNAQNALAAIAAANHVGVPIDSAAMALRTFLGVKRRLELKGVYAGVTCYDDFGHHPTAIKKVLANLRESVAASAKIFVLLELASYTMRTGLMAAELRLALLPATHTYMLSPVDSCYDWGEWAGHEEHITLCQDTEQIAAQVALSANSGDIIISFSSRSFAGIHDKVKQHLLQAVVTV